MWLALGSYGSCAVAILELKKWGGGHSGAKKKVGVTTLISISDGDFLLFWWLSCYDLPYQTQYRLMIIVQYELAFLFTRDLKRHCRCNHTRVLLCRIFSANHATSTALHMWNETPFSVHNCAAPHERKQLHESEYNSHESETVPTTNSILTKTSRLLIVN